MMEMDNTSRGRSFDRSSRNPATLKKPRLITDEQTILHSNDNPNGNSRPIVQRQSVGFRSAVERDGDSELMRGEGYQPQSLSQIKQQQHQELVSQYRTALAELTFNSKPIITNLTIIAGENAQAAKAIAGTICNNIIEVPSDQKLPSLYLLDSIVKNIGRDYIKHFSSKLPEVFCKAYRQVDSAVHPGMRHLFGTWKGVFPPQSLQLIEKELGFQSVGNGSSSGLTMSRSESQPQRSGRSIHVNPKYLEARQKLQQSSRAKGAAGDISTNLINSPEDTGRPDRMAANINPERTRADPRLKLHNIPQAQRDVESDLTHETSGAAYNNFDFGSDISSPSEASFGKSSDRVAEQGLEKSWYGSGSNSTETISRLARNGFDIKHGLPNYSAPRSATADVKLPVNNLTSKRGGEVSRSWKNSEEEEYMWDDVSSRSVIPNSSISSKRDPRLYFEPERPGFENHLQKPHRLHDLGSRLEREPSPDQPPTEPKDQPAFRQRIPSLRSSLTDENGRLGAARKLLDNAGGFSTSLQSSTVPSQSRGRINTGLSSQSHQESSQPRPQISHLGNSRKPQVHNSHSLSPQLPVSHPIKHDPFLPPYQPEPVSEPSAQSSKPLPPQIFVAAKPLVSSSLDHPKSLVADIPGPSSTSGLLAAVSSIFGNKPISSTLSPNVANTAPNHVSSLLDTLVAKGLISASKDDNRLSDPTPTKSQSQSQSQSDDPPIPQEVSPIIVSSVLSTSSMDSEPISSKPAVNSSVTIPQSKIEDVKSLVGFKFKSDVIREFHPAVISGLIDDLPHQCNICGLRFKLQERFDKHMEWHTLSNSESNTLNTSRRWFLNSDDWVNGNESTTSMGCTEEALVINGEQMVTADESRFVCILCGEMFDDFYSPERNKWMFRGAAYLNVTNGKVENISDGALVVHVNCILEHSLSDLGLANDVKMEKGV